MGDYQSQINSMISNQKYLMSGVNTIYPSFSLGDLVNKERDAQFNIINAYGKNQGDQRIQTRLNLANLYNEQNQVLDISKKLMGDNRNTYNLDFNENVEKIDQLNNIISTKNKIIKINEYEQTKKDRIIYIMQKIILFLILMILPVIFMAMGYLSVIIGIIFILVCAIITVVVVFFQMKNNEDNDLVNIANKTRNTAKDFAKTVVKNVFPKDFIKSCPSKVNPKVTVQYDYNTGNEVWLDNSQNVWKDGDIPENILSEDSAPKNANKQEYLALSKKNEPSPYYGGDALTPQYTCEWTSDPAKMTDMSLGPNNPKTRFTSTIPCEYYPGYKTISKDSS
jgi:heme/copper-type cytochrome/quinol oxidase subunit 4